MTIKYAARVFALSLAGLAARQNCEQPAFGHTLFSGLSRARTTRSQTQCGLLSPLRRPSAPDPSRVTTPRQTSPGPSRRCATTRPPQTSHWQPQCRDQTPSASACACSPPTYAALRWALMTRRAGPACCDLSLSPAHSSLAAQWALSTVFAPPPGPQVAGYTPSLRAYSPLVVMAYGPRYNVIAPHSRIPAVLSHAVQSAVHLSAIIFSFLRCPARRPHPGLFLLSAAGIYSLYCTRPYYPLPGYLSTISTLYCPGIASCSRPWP